MKEVDVKVQGQNVKAVQLSDDELRATLATPAGRTMRTKKQLVEEIRRLLNEQFSSDELVEIGNLTPADWGEILVVTTPNGR